MSQDPTTLARRIFGWASPAPMLDGTVPDAWRVTHRDAMERLLVALDYRLGGPGYARVAYVEHDGGSLWVGLVDNRDRAAHAAAVEQLAAELRGVGLKVRIVRRDGLASGVRVIDPLRGQFRAGTEAA